MCGKCLLHVMVTVVVVVAMVLLRRKEKENQSQRVRVNSRRPNLTVMKPNYVRVPVASLCLSLALAWAVPTATPSL